MLQHLYPNYSWVPWKFGRVPRGHWDNQSNIKNYLLAVQQEMNIHEASDLNSLTHQYIVAHRLNYLSQIPGGAWCRNSSKKIRN